LGLLNTPDFDHRICGADLMTRSKMHFLQQVLYGNFISADFDLKFDEAFQ